MFLEYLSVTSVALAKQHAFIIELIVNYTFLVDQLIL